MHYDEAIKHCIFRYLSGSHAYGMNTPESDEDYRGVFVAPMINAFRLFQGNWIGQGSVGQHLRNALESLRLGEHQGAKDRIKEALEEDQGDLKWSVQTVQRPGHDEELHELRKFMKLATECNPNIIEFLFVEKGISYSTPAWEEIRENNRLFLSKRARYTFGCYAAAQLRRIENHRRYLLMPPKAKPERKAFGLSEGSKIRKEHQHAILALPLEHASEEKRDEVRREQAYNTALRDWKDYQKWAKERNPKRKELEAKVGYDAKHAAHLVRLLRMAYEILSEGKVIVFRPDAEELLDIRQCRWPYDKLIAHVNEMEKKIEEADKVSALPKGPNHGEIADLYLEVVEEHYGITLDHGD